jgi:hypothetical protein
MKYADGTTVALGDIVILALHDGNHEACVVMIGDTFEHLDLEPSFVKWAREDEVIDDSSVAVRILGTNPFGHNDSRYAPIGDVIFTPLDEDIRKIRNETGA